MGNSSDAVEIHVFIIKVHAAVKLIGAGILAEPHSVEIVSHYPALMRPDYLALKRTVGLAVAGIEDVDSVYDAVAVTVVFRIIYLIVQLLECILYGLFEIGEHAVIVRTGIIFRCVRQSHNPRHIKHRSEFTAGIVIIIIAHRAVAAVFIVARFVEHVGYIAGGVRLKLYIAVFQQEYQCASLADSFVGGSAIGIEHGDTLRSVRDAGRLAHAAQLLGCSADRLAPFSAAHERAVGRAGQEHALGVSHIVKKFIAVQAVFHGSAVWIDVLQEASVSGHGREAERNGQGYERRQVSIFHRKCRLIRLQM